jgi:hypothetical protein
MDQPSVPHDRAGVAKGAAADVSPAFCAALALCSLVQVPTKYKPDAAIQISEVYNNKRYPKALYVSNTRKSPKTGKVEYQLRETKDETGVYYRNGHWFPEKEVHILK